MRFLRERRGEVESVWARDNGAAEKSNALAVLKGCVVIVRHPYQRDPQSGAGNCWCGRHAGSSLHAVVGDPTDDGAES